jgi:hypothetical protein
LTVGDVNGPSGPAVIPITTSFNAYTSASKIKGDYGYASTGTTTNFSEVDARTIKASNEFDK